MPRCFTLLVKVANLIILASLLVSCAEPSQAVRPATATPTQVPTPLYTATPAPTLPVPEQFNESLIMAQLTRAQVLLPVAERLPENPKVVKPVDQVGKHGGTWRMVIQSQGDEEQFIRTVAYEPLVRWTTDWSGVEPNLVESYEVNPKATEFTFTLRRGIRWSDGKLFTTEDIRFWYEDVLLNRELTPYIPAWLTSRGKPAQFEFVNDTVFRVKFSTSNGLFLENLATPDALVIAAFPRHYVSQFHINYADPKQLEMMQKEGGYRSWVELFTRKVGVSVLSPGYFSDPERPRLTPWVLQTPYTKQYQSIIWRRNPFYWKVDPQGNQLPYLDYVIFSTVSSVDQIIVRALAGEIDMQNLDKAGTEVYTTFGSRTNNDQYRFYSLDNGMNNVMVINFNLAHPDPVKRGIFQNQYFRIALSHAINRQEIIDRVFNGQGKPWQAAPREGSPFYDPTMALQYTQFDPKKANDYLDRAGFLKDPLGQRLGPNGEPISFTLMAVDDDPKQIAMMNMVAGYWSQIGISAHPKVEPQAIFNSMVQSNLHDAAAAQDWGSYYMDVLLDPHTYVAVSDNSLWAINWAKWHAHIPGYEKDQPPNAARFGLDIYDQVTTTINREEQIRLMKRAMVISRQSFWTIGIALAPQQYGIVQRGFKNVPDIMPSSWLYPDPGPANPEQFFIDQN